MKIQGKGLEWKQLPEISGSCFYPCSGRPELILQRKGTDYLKCSECGREPFSIHQGTLVNLFVQHLLMNRAEVLPVWKLLRSVRYKGRDSLASLFMERAARRPLHRWLKAENKHRAGYAVRPGWHCCRARWAPHLKICGRVWCRAVVKDWEFVPRPLAQGGSWILAQQMMLLGREDKAHGCEY